MEDHNIIKDLPTDLLCGILTLSMPRQLIYKQAGKSIILEVPNLTGKSGGKPQITIDFDEFERLTYIGCEEQEIADYFAISRTHLKNLLAEHYGEPYMTILERQKSRFRQRLRDILVKQAEMHNSNVIIFLAKNYLGMVDVQKTDVSVDYYSKALEFLKELKELREVPALKELPEAKPAIDVSHNNACATLKAEGEPIVAEFRVIAEPNGT